MRTNFTTSTPITSEFLNKVARPRISTLDDDGAIPPITNEGLANTPGNVLYDFYDFVDQFAVLNNIAGGLSVTVKGGAVRLPDGSNLTVSQSNVAVPNNTVSFISIGSNGSIQATTIRPTYGYTLARVTTLNGVVTLIDDLRVNQTISPQANTVDTFGGINQIDYTVAPNTTVNLSGAIECKNFILPSNSTIRVEGALVIRASGNVDILGTVTTSPNTNAFLPFQDGIYGGGNYAITYASGSTNSIPVGGNPIRSRRRNPAFIGYSQIEFTTQTVNINAATRLSYGGSSIGAGCANGADFTIHAAGVLTIGNNASINLRAIQPVKPVSIPASLITLNGHPTTGTFADWRWIYNAISPQGSAGVCVLQSTTTVNINQGAVINCRGTDEGWAIYTGAGNLGGAITFPGTLGNGWFKCGAGGGGGIWIYAPVINSHPSATYDVAAGTMGVPSGSNLYVQGVGSVGSGYGNSTTPAQNGQLVVTTGYPTEF